MQSAICMAFFLPFQFHLAAPSLPLTHVQYKWEWETVNHTHSKPTCAPIIWGKLYKLQLASWLRRPHSFGKCKLTQDYFFMSLQHNVRIRWLSTAVYIYLTGWNSWLWRASTPSKAWLPRVIIILCLCIACTMFHYIVPRTECRYKVTDFGDPESRVCESVLHVLSIFCSFFFFSPSFGSLEFCRISIFLDE